jgi:hypothetical protein
MLMLGEVSQNLSPVLEMAWRVYQGLAAYLSPAGGDSADRKVEYFAACVRFGLDEPEAIQCLHTGTDELSDALGWSRCSRGFWTAHWGSCTRTSGMPNSSIRPAAR